MVNSLRVKLLEVILRRSRRGAWQGGAMRGVQQGMQ